MGKGRHQTLLGTNRTQGRLLSGTEVISVDSRPDPCWLSTSGNTTEARNLKLKQKYTGPFIKPCHGEERERRKGDSEMTISLFLSSFTRKISEITCWQEF
ncbi:hypothetical protein EYF80_031507 [Liparis tanakae]|uniref:Uncharacterized protein n=1 Tax=Liparis tanakae TaxID=230148 RepID=A0A4Z2GX87_9TELE|nr:hypothetical protein EYF80_031507 [Liparis tanakae]